MHDLLMMNGYGWYVWPAYLITLSVFGVNIILSMLEKKRVHNEIKLLINPSPVLADARTPSPTRGEGTEYS